MSRSSILVLVCLAGCGDTSGTGTLQVFAAAEDTIPDGLEPGTGDENIQDGWTVQYDKFLISIGNFRASRSTSPSDRLSEPKTWILDLKALPTDGFVLANLPKVTATRWDKVGFDLPNASAASQKAAITSQADHDFMVQNGYSIYFEMTLTKSDGQSCKPSAPADCVPRTGLKAKWGLKAGTAFDDCAPPMGDAGFAVPTGGTVQVKPTIHGDHWFFSNLTQGAELTSRFAQWIVDADLDRDGETTLTELKGVKASDVFKAPTYNLTGASIPINNAHDYLEAQARTLGDYQGEGECPTRRVLP
jgi:hypothetical protein